MADDLFHLLSSSARIKKKARNRVGPSSSRKDAARDRANFIQDFQQKQEDMKKRKLNQEDGISDNDSKSRQIHTEEIAAFRRRMKIRVAETSRCPDPICSFGDLTCAKAPSKLFHSVKSTLLANIENGKWLEPTPVQMQAIPAILAGNDIMAAAPTGSGKSGAFIIPSLILSKCISKKGKAGQIRALLLAPSRELATQLYRETVRLGTSMPGKMRCALLSKNNFKTLVAGHVGGDAGIDILISTPLRLCEACQTENSKVDLSTVEIIVLDEADRLLDATDGITKDKQVDSTGTTATASKESGGSHAKTFVEQIDFILSKCNSRAQRAMFSATMGGRIRNLADTILRSPVDIAVNSKGSSLGANENIDQKLIFVGREEGKLLEIRKYIHKGIKPPVLIFLQSQDRARALYKELRYEKMKVDIIHAGKSQSARDESVKKFRKGETWILICTDLVARGVDFKAVNLVINYDLPSNGVTYVHRIGRTGRAGRTGQSITFFTETDFAHLRTIANVLKISGCDVADWMLHLKKPNQFAKQRLVPKKRQRVDAK
mmetsp:Transcript_17318/g.22533  ORF Transcript_17318/g.22533 Transcript_17318/m.22533 type:complete len:547 (+) Transcript_17318:94-1734(+)